MALRHDRLEVLDRYLRIPTVSRQVTPEMVEAVRALWRGLGLELTPLMPVEGEATPALYGELPGPAGAVTDVLGMPCLWIPAANSNNQQHDINEHYVLRHFYRQTTLYAAIVSSRPL